MNSTPKNIIVIGASAGGLNAVSSLVGRLKPNLDAAYCIVLHLSEKSVGNHIVRKLSEITSMECYLAVDGSLIEKDHVYIAPSNHHLLIKENKIKLGKGPEENRWRPSIDVLFRSAAVSFGTHCVGIILSGLLDDGTSGMSAIKKCGGICIIQNPEDAEYPDMPLSVMRHITVDYVYNASEIGSALVDILNKLPTKKIETPWQIAAEAKIAEQTAVGIDDIEKLPVEKSVFACPDCGGNLWEVKDDVITRYRCHIGHAYSQRDLAIKQSEKAGETLWVALRMMEERKHLLKKIEVESKQRGLKSITINNVDKQKRLEQHISTLREILFEVENIGSD